MATKTQKTKVGVFLIVCVAMMVGGLFLIKGVSTAATTNYWMEFDDSILGLSTGSMVEYLGVPVGSVIDIYVNDDGTARVHISVEVEKVTLREGVTATLVWFSPVAGTMAIELRGGEADAPVLANESTIPVEKSIITSFTNSFGNLLVKLEGAMDEITGFMHNIRMASDGMEAGALMQVVENVNGLLVNSSEFVDKTETVMVGLTLSAQRAIKEYTQMGKDMQYLAEDVGEAVEGANAFIKMSHEKLEPLNIEAIQVDLQRAVANIADFTEKLDKTVSFVTVIGESVLHETDNIEHSVRDSLDSLTEAVDSVNALVQAIQQDPAALIRGRGKPKAAE